MAQLYAYFEANFLGNGGTIASTCGHEILCFDHHFFHLAGVRTEETSRLFMRDEKDNIKTLLDGFGKYILDHNGSRARNLPSALATMTEPDEVWEDHPSTSTARWVYVKEFSSKPYPFTVALLVDRPEESGIIVPVSSFPCRKSDIQRWRRGTRIHPKTDTAT